MSNESEKDQPAKTQQPAITIQMGRFKLQGRSAAIVLFLIAMLIAVRLIYKPPVINWPLMLSVAGWVLFSVYWSIAAKNSAPAKSSEAPKSRQIHQLLLNSALLLILIPVPGLKQPLPPAGVLLWPAGLVVQAAFGLLAVWARRHLASNWSGEITIKVDHQLIRSGPYRLVRHPIYTAMLGMAAGSALVSGQLHALLGLGLMVFAYWRKIRLEEANLNQAFGPAYAAYRQKTWALIPGLY
jgi:protein-S-isoprenylcysteine O-methyltransferase Ste14